MADLLPFSPAQAQCFVKHRKKWHTDMGKFTFQGYCGYYWKSALLWEWVYVRGCALGACNENGIFYEGPDYYDRLPTWIHQGNTTLCPHIPYNHRARANIRGDCSARRQWLIGHCRGIRDIENYHEKHASGPEWTDSW
jgi:hypothetical protein